ALDQMGLPRTHLHCVSMPGFGTSGATRDASRGLADALGADFTEEDIRAECLLVLRAQQHPVVVAYDRWLAESGTADTPDVFTDFLRRSRELTDVEFENVQARV